MKYRAPHNGFNAGNVFARVLGLTALCALLALIPANALASTGHRYAGQFATPGSGDGQLSGPTGIAVNQRSNAVYVVDAGNNRVERFNAAGDFDLKFDGSGTPATSFSNPQQVAVDSASGDVYVVDSGNNVIDVFNSSGVYQRQVNGSATPATTFSGPTGVAVDPASGDLYVADTSNNVIDVFDSTGVYQSQIDTSASASSPTGVAVDSSGNVYALGSGLVQRFAGDGRDLGTLDANGVVALGVDPTTDHVYVGENGAFGYQVADYDSTGTLEAIFGSSHIGSALQLAVNGSNAKVFVADQVNSVVEQFAAFTAPTVSLAAPTNLTPTSVDLHGLVDPSGTQTSAHFDWGTEATYGNQTADQDMGSGSGAAALDDSLSGLTPNTTYHYRVSASNANGSNTTRDGSFTTPPTLPVIGTAAFASDITTTRALFHASLDPQNSDTTWHYEFGTDTSYGQSTPDQFISGNGDRPIGINPNCTTSPSIDSCITPMPGLDPSAQPYPPLLPGTLYHFRLVATNGAGTLDGPDQTFRTASATLPSAEDITMNTATLTGVVNPDNDPSATYHFEFWFGFPPATPEMSVGGTVDDLDHTVTAPISDLQAGHTYSVLLVSTVHGQTVTSDLGQFSTAPPPTVTITGVSDVTQTSVRVNAIVDTHGLTGEYNLSFNSQSTPPLEIPNAAAGPQQVSVVLSDLLGDWSYSVTVLARASNGVLGESEPFTFRTAPWPPRPTFGPPASFDYPPSPPDDTGTTPAKPTRCPKGKVRKKVHGKSKCVKKPRHSGK